MKLFIAVTDMFICCSSAEQLYTDYDMSEMAFNPAVPLPKKVQPKSKSGRTIFTDPSFEIECKNIVRESKKNCKGLLWNL